MQIESEPRINLRPWQEAAIVAIEAAVAERGIALFTLASGLGKTITVAAWLQRARRPGERTLFLCHDTAILEQAAREFSRVFDSELSMAMFHGEEKEYSSVDILFATFQTLRTWKDAFLPEDFAHILVDESHHAMAESYAPVIRHFRPRALVAFTATPDRMDGQDIRSLFGEEIYSVVLEEGIANRWLADVEYRVCSHNLDPTTIGRIAAEVADGRNFTLRELNETLFIEHLDEEVAKTILAEKRNGIVFCESIAHAEHFAHFLPSAAVYHSGRPQEENVLRLEWFKAGKLRFLLAVDKLNEGIDMPKTKLLVFMRCTSSQTVFLQQLGRGLRKESDHVLVLDFVANCERVLQVRELTVRVKALANPGDETEALTVSGDGFHFAFSQEQLNIIDIVRSLQRASLKIADIPHLAAEFDREKNAPLTPETVQAGTYKKLWWKCGKCEHGWQAVGRSRASGTGCPACTNKVVTLGNCLATTHPHLAAEFDLVKNFPLTPETVVAGTSKKLWWKCGKCEHGWQAGGINRARRGSSCLACRNKVVTLSNCLAATHPHLAAEFDLVKNFPLTPETVVAGTSKKLWWKCGKCEHGWSASGDSRSRNPTGGCPSCTNQTVTKNNCLAKTHPHLAAEFDLVKNFPLTPETVMAGTNKKLWWKCGKCEHGWSANGNNRRRNTGGGCPSCSRTKAHETRRRSKN